MDNIVKFNKVFEEIYKKADANCKKKLEQLKIIAQQIQAVSTSKQQEIDKLTVTLKPLGLISVSRTGAVAMTKGKEIFIQN